MSSVSSSTAVKADASQTKTTASQAQANPNSNAAALNSKVNQLAGTALLARESISVIVDDETALQDPLEIQEISKEDLDKIKSSEDRSRAMAQAVWIFYDALQRPMEHAIDRSLIAYCKMLGSKQMGSQAENLRATAEKCHGKFISFYGSALEYEQEVSKDFTNLRLDLSGVSKAAKSTKETLDDLAKSHKEAYEKLQKQFDVLESDYKDLSSTCTSVVSAWEKQEIAEKEKALADLKIQEEQNKLKQDVEGCRNQLEQFLKDILNSFSMISTVLDLARNNNKLCKNEPLLKEIEAVWIQASKEAFQAKEDISKIIGTVSHDAAKKALPSGTLENLQKIAKVASEIQKKCLAYQTQAGTVLEQMSVEQFRTILALKNECTECRAKLHKYLKDVVDLQPEIIKIRYALQKKSQESQTKLSQREISLKFTKCVSTARKAFSDLTAIFINTKEISETINTHINILHSLQKSFEERMSAMQEVHKNMARLKEKISLAEQTAKTAAMAVETYK